MSDDTPLHKQLEENAAAHRPETTGKKNFFLGILENVFEMADPFEAVGIIFEGEGGLAALAAVAVFAVACVVIGFFLVGLWSVVQEALSSGGPPQGLGLR
jgi:hypothetical protein